MAVEWLASSSRENGDVDFVICFVYFKPNNGEV
jgi:hypothetical protein